MLLSFELLTVQHWFETWNIHNTSQNVFMLSSQENAWNINKITPLFNSCLFSSYLGFNLHESWKAYHLSLTWAPKIAAWYTRIKTLTNILSIKQSMLNDQINQSNHPSINKTSKQSMNQWIELTPSINQATKKSINRSDNRLVNATGTWVSGTYHFVRHFKFQSNVVLRGDSAHKLYCQERITGPSFFAVHRT